MGVLSLQDGAEAWGWGAHSPPSLWFVGQHVRVRQEEMCPQSRPPTLCVGRGVRAAESFADRCRPLQIEKHSGGGRGKGGHWPGSRLPTGERGTFVEKGGSSTAVCARGQGG